MRAFVGARDRAGDLRALHGVGQRERNSRLLVGLPANRRASNRWFVRRGAAACRSSAVAVTRPTSRNLGRPAASPHRRRSGHRHSARATEQPSAEKRPRCQDHGLSRRFPPRAARARRRVRSSASSTTSPSIKVDRRAALPIAAPRPDRDPVDLRARAAHGRSLAAVEQAIADRRAHRRTGSSSAEGIDLPNHMPLAEPADGRITAQLAQIRLAKTSRGRRAPHARRGVRSFDARMAGPDDDNDQRVS